MNQEKKIEGKTRQEWEQEYQKLVLNHTEYVNSLCAFVGMEGIPEAEQMYSEQLLLLRVRFRLWIDKNFASYNQELYKDER